MDLNKIAVGNNPPWDVNCLIEVPLGSEPVKYELDKPSGALFVDRILHTAMRYPCNYGFVPHTLAEDDDPVDIMIANRTPIMPGAVCRVRPIGVLNMVDEEGVDDKILAVPVDKLHPFFSGISSYEELPQITLDQISHFFEHYKDLEPDKWTEVKGWKGPDAAAKVIEEAIDRAGGATFGR